METMETKQGIIVGIILGGAIMGVLIGLLTLTSPLPQNDCTGTCDCTELQEAAIISHAMIIDMRREAGLPEDRLEDFYPFRVT